MHRALLASAAMMLAFGCAPGDHSKSAQLTQLFGGGAAPEQDPNIAPDPGAPLDSSPISGTSVIPRNNGAGSAVTTRSSPSQAVSTAIGSGANMPSAPQQQSGNAPTTGAGGFMGVGATNTVDPPTGDTFTTGETPPATDAGSDVKCEQGYVAVGGACTCELSGTFAFQGIAPVSLVGSGPVEALDDTIQLWGIARHDYDAQAGLSLTLSWCGQTTPDICASAQPPALPSPEAYGQFIPLESWTRASTSVTAELPLAHALPGEPFITPTIVQLFGISLADPFGAWPTTRKDIEGSPNYDGSSVNGAQWLDSDDDGKLGLSTIIVPPGGLQGTATAGPPGGYTAESSACPRDQPRAARSRYMYIPFPQGLGVERIAALYMAQRLALELSGVVESCDRITGVLTGPSGADIRLDGVLGGCSTINGSAQEDCSASLLSTAESGGGATSLGLNFGIGDFVLTRADTDTTCADVRALPLLAR